MYLDLLSPDLNDERLQCEVLKKLLSDGIHREMLAKVKIWVGCVRYGGSFCVFVVEVESVLTVDSLCVCVREREYDVCVCDAEQYDYTYIVFIYLGEP